MHAKTLMDPRRFAKPMPINIDSAVGSVERSAIRRYTGRKVSDHEAQYLWPRITDHKWYLSERLSRDVGFHVAAVDYLENFYQPIVGEKNTVSVSKRAKGLLRLYLEAKGNTIPL